MLGLFVVLKFMSVQEVKRIFPFDLVLIIGSALGVAQVLMNSGVAEMLGNGIKEATESLGVYGSFAAVYLIVITSYSIHYTKLYDHIGNIIGFLC